MTAKTVTEAAATKPNGEGHVTKDKQKSAASSAKGTAGKRARSGNAESSSGSNSDSGSEATTSDESQGGWAVNDTSKKRAGRGRRKRGARGRADDDDDLLAGLDADTEAAREQRGLVRTAFVEGMQQEDFEKELEEDRRKKEGVEAEPERLAGWGSWTGPGTLPPKPRKPRKQIAALQPATVKKSEHVKILEGADEASKKFFADQVPYDLRTNPNQYNDQLRMPLGPEWNTPNSFAERVKPKLFVKIGAVVTPLQHVRHLPKERRECAITAWASKKKRTRLKTRL
eukprot:NODE_11037_length_1312_cov_5.508017.p1 GENE.NODE_11037_length_1312_cov_5.508017~~NODE_11037_length_1312_cov_5.508017.p1  ORF type:complete len:285 (+),score=68.78 NODE_11037_length_1312_cov_5.508017:433-1287(+)